MWIILYLVDAILGLPDAIDVATAKELRTRLIARIDEFKVLNKKAPAIGQAKKLIGLVDNAISKDLPEQANNAWREANAFYKEGQEQFNNAIIRKLLKKAEDTGTGIPHRWADGICTVYSEWWRAFAGSD